MFLGKTCCCSVRICTSVCVCAYSVRYNYCGKKMQLPQLQCMLCELNKLVGSVDHLLIDRSRSDAWADAWVGEVWQLSETFWKLMMRTGSKDLGREENDRKNLRNEKEVAFTCKRNLTGGSFLMLLRAGATFFLKFGQLVVIFWKMSLNHLKVPFQR